RERAGRGATRRAREPGPAWPHLRPAAERPHRRRTGQCDDGRGRLHGPGREPGHPDPPHRGLHPGGADEGARPAAPHPRPAIEVPMTIYTYDPTLNPAYRAPAEDAGPDDPPPVWAPDAIPGVPVRDLDADDLRALPARLRASIAACPFYVLADANALAELEAELAPPPEPEPLGVTGRREEAAEPEPPAVPRRARAK